MYEIEWKTEVTELHRRTVTAGQLAELGADPADLDKSDIGTNDLSLVEAAAGQPDTSLVRSNVTSRHVTLLRET